MSNAAFCTACGGPLEVRYLEEEQRERQVCSACKRIHYVNPNIVAGALPQAGDRIWLLRRAIEPRYGMWTFPAGFMEMGDSVEEAALRETREELNLTITLTGLLNVYSRPTTPTVLVVYLAEAQSEPSVGHETLDFASFLPDEIPWPQLAFWNTVHALQDWIKTLS